ncbi:MAG TPA: hypothetical protein VLU73_00530 [Methylococcaceae bacterium]|jgi:hypothetical protein|nr:hypothetical protein [Methylococcaceae bacterium]
MSPICDKSGEAIVVGEKWNFQQLEPIFTSHVPGINPADRMPGSLSVAIIDAGGFLGVGGHHVSIPVQQSTQITPKIILPSAESPFRQAPLTS